MLLMLICAIVFAFEDSSEAAELWRKTQELNQLADRFRAETGFRGQINYGYERMRLSSFEGKFTDIHVTAETDTSTFRVAFETILDKVLPYTFARREQLTRSRITNNLGRIKTEYIQQINGYRVEGAGRISIVYETGRYGFAIGNGTVELPTVTTTPVISFEDAVRIYYDVVVEDYANKYSPIMSPKFRLRYCNIYEYKFDIEPVYRLCWVGGSMRKLVIDAVSGEIYVNELAVVHDLTPVYRDETNPF